MAAQQEKKEVDVEVVNDLELSNISPNHPAENSLIGSTQSSMVSLEQYQEKMDKIE